MAKTLINSILTMVMGTLGLCATVASADSNDFRAIDLHAYEETIARDDRDASPADRIAAACEVGFATRALAKPADACAVAYEKATREKRFEQARLYQAACGRLGYALGCESLRELSQRVNRRELEEVTEILERETGVALAGRSRGQQVNLRELHAVTEILEREVGDGLRAACATANCDAGAPTAANSGARVLTGW